MRYVESLRLALDEVLRNSKSAILLGEDIVDPYGGAFKVTRGLSSSYPGQVFSTPISEAAIVGMGCGLSLRRMTVIVEIMFGDFLSLAFDQILNHITKYPLMYGDTIEMNIVIRTPMGGGRGYGPTHSQNLEKFFLGMPELQLLSPSILHDPGISLKKSCNYKGPVLFIEGKKLYPQNLIEQKTLENSDWTFYNQIEDLNYPGTVVNIKNSIAVKSPDICIISFGSTFSIIEKAADILLIEDEITIELFMIENLTHIDYEIFEKSITETGRVLLIEEGSVTLGVMAEVATRIYTRFFNSLTIPVSRIGADDWILPSAKQLEDKVLPSVNDIVKCIRKMVL